VQLTAASVCGKFGQAAFETANRLLEADMVTVVATDTHNIANRPPILNEARTAIAEKLGEEKAELFTQTNPAKIAESRVDVGIAP